MSGMLAQSRIKVIPFNTQPASKDWEGTWVNDGGNRIMIRSKAGTDVLEIQGEARWDGGVRDNGEEILHFGDVHGSVAPSGNQVMIRYGDSPFDCALDLELVGDFLGAVDNMHCGGMNVSFSDVYRRDTSPSNTSMAPDPQR